MARRVASAGPAVPPPASAPAGGGGPVPIIQRPDGLEIEFPPELLGSQVAPLAEAPAGGPPPQAELAPPPVVVAPPALAPAPPAPVVAEVTAPVPPSGGLLGEINRARQQYQEQLARMRGAPPEGPKPYAYQFKRPNHPDHDYDKLPNLNVGFERALAHHGTTLGEELLRLSREERGQDFSNLRAELTLQNVIRSTRLWKVLRADYAEKVKTSGFNDMIEVDTATGRPTHPDKYDPVTRHLWLTDPDPGGFAYQAATELLAGQAPAAPPAGGPGPGGTNGAAGDATSRATALRAQVEAAALETAARRPQSIASLPAAAGSGTRRILRSVDDMTDREFTWFWKNRPEVIQALKANALKSMTAR